MSKYHFVAVDLGAGSGRVILASLIEKRLSLKELHRFSGYLLDGGQHLRWDMNKIYREIFSGLHRIPAGLRVAGLGIDTWGVDFAALDEMDRLIESPVAYRDSRTDGMMDLLDKQISRAEIYKMTGIQFMKLNTLYQLLAIREKQPELFEVTKQCLLMPDYFAFLFTGIKNSEYTIASTTQLLDVHTKKWSADLFTHIGFPVDIFPPVQLPGRSLGNIILKDMPKALHDTQFISTASHDTASAIAAAPAVAENWIYISSGTWSLMGIESRRPFVSDQALRYNFTNEGGVNGTYRFLKNIMGMWLLERFKHDTVHTAEYQDILALAQAVPVFRHFIDVDDERFLNPSNMRDAINQFLKETGQNLPESPGEYYRLIFDNLALKYLHVYKILQELTGRSFSNIHIIGGGSRNTLLCQLTADLTGLTVVAGPVEATAIGNVLLQTKAVGIISDMQEGRRMVRDSFDVIEYHPNRMERREKIYREYLAITGES